MYDFKNKSLNVRNTKEYMFIKTLGMFDYDGLPDTLPEEEMERILQEQGATFIYEHNGEIYAFPPHYSGVRDMYDRPTEINVNSVYLDLSKTVPIDEGVLIRNDDYSKGLTDLFDKHTFLLNENEISMTMNTINNRIQNIMSAGDDRTKASAEQFLQKIEDGDLSVIGENQLFEGLKVHNAQSNNSTSITNLFEFQQYIKASMYNEVGIDLNFNMKRERLNSGEVSQNAEMLFPLVNNMFRNRKEGIEKLNEKFNLSVTFDYGSIWKKRDDENVKESEEVIESEETEESEEIEETEETEETDDEEEEN